MRKGIVYLGALLLPLMYLAFWVLYQQRILITGSSFEFPIEAYDPRDLLAGHYLQYTVDYGVDEQCAIQDASAYLCLKPKKYVLKGSNLKQCKLFIKGTCHNGRFSSSIDRFYIPANKGLALQKSLISNKATIQVKVSLKGQARVESMKIFQTNGKVIILK